MSWVTVVVGIVCLLIGFLIGVWFCRDVGHKVGTFIVDKWNPEINGGVYTVFDDDPLKFRNGQHVTLDVITADLGKSQQNQGA